MSPIDPEIIKHQVSLIRYTGQTKTVKTQDGISYLAEIKPTNLQNKLNHVRQHPPDEVGLNALGPQVREMLDELLPLLPVTTMGWWVTTRHRENRRRKGKGSQ